jgi:hypothetical protein
MTKELRTLWKKYVYAAREYGEGAEVTMVAHRAYTKAKKAARPKVGTILTGDRGPMQITRVYPFGTVDVVDKSGNMHRITGLNWL